MTTVFKLDGHARRVWTLRHSLSAASRVATVDGKQGVRGSNPLGSTWPEAIPLDSRLRLICVDNLMSHGQVSAALL
jgi:hypothetical protein